MTFGGHKLSSTAVRYQNQLARMPKSTSCSQTVLNGRQTSEPIGKNAQIAVRVHKRSSTSDTCQNQLARMPKQYLVSQIVLNIRHTSEPTGKNAHIALTLTYGKVAVCTPVCSRLTHSWSLSAPPRCKFPFRQWKAQVGSQCQEGEKQRGFSKKKMVLIAARNTSHIPY